MTRLEYRGLELGRKDLATIQRWIDREGWLTREEVSRRACRHFGWRQADGRWAVRGGRSFLEGLERGGLLRLPAAKRAGNYFHRREGSREAQAVAVAETEGLALDGELVVRPVASEAERGRWHGDIARHHYLGDGGLIGESLCYTAWIGLRAVAHLGYAAAALRNTARDGYIGWDQTAKRRGLWRVVSNVRFLILPGVIKPNLASQILSATCRRLVADWQQAYGHEVWLAETFVDASRFRGTCYRAANWICVGQTRGFSRRGATYEPNGSPKLVFVYPLVRDARGRLRQAEVQDAVGPRAAKKKQEGGRTMLDVEQLALEGRGGLFDLLATISDPRKARGKRHTMQSVLALAAVAMLCGSRSLAALTQFARELPEAARRRLGCRPLRPPSEPTFRRVLKTIDVVELDRKLCQWIAEQGSPRPQAIALDGKTLRGSAETDRPAVHLVSALAHDTGVVVAQTRVADKTNEIKSVVPLLDHLDVEGAVITGDAMMTQREIARYVVEQKHADYFFTVKDNQLTLRQDIQHLGLAAFPPSGETPRRDRR